MKKVYVKGPFLTQSGYGHHARTVIRALRTREDLFDVYLHPINWGATSWDWRDSEERRWIDSTLEKTISYTNECNGQPVFDVSLQVTIPSEWEKIALYNIGVTAGIETNKISPQWIEKTAIVDQILTISQHSKNGFVETVYEATRNDNGEKIDFKCQKPVEYISYPVRKFDPSELNLNLSTNFNFLTVAQFGPRKNLENLIKCFVEQFREEEDVGLIIKTNMAKNSLIDRINSANTLKSLTMRCGEKKCKIYLLHGSLSDNEMSGLYTHPKIKAMVTATHGEGFCLPLFEAAHHGLPVIATDWSGHLDFLYKPTKQKNGKIKHKHMFSRISYTMGPVQQEAVWDGIITKDSMWAFPEEGSIKMNLEEVHKDYGRFKKRAKELQKWLCEEFTEEKIYDKYVRSIYGSDLTQISREELPKISLITSVYRAEEHIEQLMEDVTRQTVFKDKCEWLILNVNDKENNFEEEVILKYKEKYPENIIYKRLDKDPGVYGVWNKAIKMSSGEFITNINCDDRRAPFALEKQASVLAENTDVDLVYNDSYMVQEPNTLYEDVKPGTPQYNFEPFSKEAMLRNNLPHNNPMWKRTLHDKYGYFDDKYRSAGDWDMWLRAAFEGGKFMKINTVLGVYYFNPKGISTNFENLSWKQEEEKEIFLKYTDQVDKIAV